MSFNSLWYPSPGLYHPWARGPPVEGHAKCGLRYQCSKKIERLDGDDCVAGRAMSGLVLPQSHSQLNCIVGALVTASKYVVIRS